MKTTRLIARLTLVIVFAFGMSPPTFANSGPSASGSGHLVTGGELRTFSFTAVTHHAGTVTGQAQLNNRAQGVRVHLDVDCLRVVGNVATVTGIIKKVTGPTAAQVGWRTFFRVIDNGEGANDPPDSISLAFSFPPGVMLDCNSPLVVPQLVIEEGNIQVRE